MNQAPAGWYDDGRGALRYWDGAGWTEHVHQPVAPPAKPRGGNVPAWVWWASGAALGVLLVTVIALTIATALRPNLRADVEEAMARYDTAFAANDCDEFLALTTEEFRETAGYSDCVAFAEAAEYYYSDFADHYSWVESVELEGDEAWVTTFESYSDQDGYHEIAGTYVLALTDGAWLVIQADFEPLYDDPTY